MSLLGGAFGLTPEWLLSQYQTIYPTTLLFLWDPDRSVCTGVPRQLDLAKSLVGPDPVTLGPHKYYATDINGRLAIDSWPAADGVGKEVRLDATCAAPVISALTVTQTTYLHNLFLVYPQIVTLPYYPGPDYGKMMLAASAPGARTFTHYVNGVATDTIPAVGFNVVEGIDTTPATATTLLRIGTYPGYNNVKRARQGMIRALSAAPTPEQRAAEIALLARYYRRSFP